MRVALASAFRNCAGNVSTYMSRVVALRDALAASGDELRLVAGEGDSTDHTRSLLDVAARAGGLSLTFMECSHGQRMFGSTEEPERLRVLSFVFNCILDGVRGDDDVFLYVEQDLKWNVPDLRRLIVLAASRSRELDVFAPLVMAGAHFYDVWAFRLNGDRFSPFHPFHAALSGRSLLQVDSVGSCFAMRADVARSVRIRDDNAIVGWCADAREKGFRIGVTTDSVVNQL